MKKLSNYYTDNLGKLGNIKKDDSIQIRHNGKQTNYFAINKESKRALINWIENM